jgi:hypothetical protein
MARAKLKSTFTASVSGSTAKRIGIDLAALQSEFTSARSGLKSAETALLRAQEARDRAVASFDAAKRALADSTRVVLG